MKQSPSLDMQTLWNFIKAQGMGAKAGWSPYQIASIALAEMGHVRASGLTWKKHCLLMADVISRLAPETITKQERRHAKKARRDKKKAGKVDFVRRAETVGYAQAGGTRMRPAPAFQPSVMGDAFLSSYEWRRVRMVALKKYGPTCQCCGATPATGAVMNVDHIKPRRIYPEIALEVNNLQILCHECNHGKGNWDMTDWRTTEQDHATDLDLEAQQHMRSI